MQNSALVRHFETFLASIPLEKYREELLPIKTVEQDLPKELIPLTDIYEQYWVDVDDVVSFMDYEEFFDAWWQSHLSPLDKFIRQYFWGCSHAFVMLGFKARLYRTLVSVLTQFHFSYQWQSVCALPMTTSTELDMKGIDLQIKSQEKTIALSVKKETYRREAAGEGRFGTKSWQDIDAVTEIPYTISLPSDYEKSLKRARTEATRERYQLSLFLATNLLRFLPNDFVVFQPQYPLAVERFITTELPQTNTKQIAWQDTLKYIMRT